MGGVLRDEINLALEEETQIARLTAVYLFPFCLNVLKLFGKWRRINKFHVLETLRDSLANEMTREDFFVLFFTDQPLVDNCQITITVG